MSNSVQSKTQAMESQKERLEVLYIVYHVLPNNDIYLQSEKVQLEQHQQTADAEVDRLSDELDQLKLTAERDKEEAQTCKSGLAHPCMLVYSEV